MLTRMRRELINNKIWKTYPDHPRGSNHPESPIMIGTPLKNDLLNPAAENKVMKKEKIHAHCHFLKFSL
jgi:hypothetical protein